MKNTAFGDILDRRKAEIVTAVLRLVDKVGITGLTTKRIAREVGFAEGALYKHVASKMDIFHLILDASVQSFAQADREISRRGLPPVAALEALFDFIISFLDEFPGIYRILFSDGLYAEDRTLFNTFKDCMLAVKDRIQTLVGKGIASGDFRPDLDPDRTAVNYLGVIHTTFTFWNVFEERSRGYAETARPYFEEYLKSIRHPSVESSHDE